MEHFEQGPSAGQTDAGTYRTDSVQPSGWRKASAASVRADQLAKAGEATQIGKGRAVVAAKRVAAHIGLKAADLLLLDTLSAFTQAQDWEAGQRPIVWASNAYLMAQTGFSLSTLKRHARRLVEVGLISFQDSPNGQRWGRRDAEGRITEAYGFDLSPLAARAEALEALGEEIAAERALCQRLKRQITVVRRMIRARIEAAVQSAIAGPWGQMIATFEGLLARLPKRACPPDQLDGLLSGFKALQDRIEATFGVLEADVDDKETVNMTPNEVSSDPRIRTTNQLHSVNSNSLENKEAAGVAPEPQMQDTKKPQGVALDLRTVMQACPEFATWARNLGGFVKDWSDLHRVAGELRPMIGVSEHAWAQAQDRLGPQIATAALVLTFDKHCAGEVASPGGYLRGMVEKSASGALHLERSFYGRLSAQAA